MDLRRSLRIAARFWYIVVPGMVLAAALAVLAVASVDVRTKTLTWRQKPTYIASTVILVTEQGGPEMRATLPAPTLAGAAKAGGDQALSSPTFGDPNRLDYLASLLAYFVRSDRVCARIGAAACRPDKNGKTKVDAQVLASAASVEQTGTASFPSGLPLIEVTGTATSPDSAMALAMRAAHALQGFVSARQRQEAVPPGDAVKLDLLRSARSAQLLQGRSKTPAVAVFSVVMLVTFGIAWAAERLWPRRVLGSAEADEPGDAKQIPDGDEPPRSPSDVPLPGGAPHPVAPSSAIGLRGPGAPSAVQIGVRQARLRAFEAYGREPE
jgi:hypothetical protein